MLKQLTDWLWSLVVAVFGAVWDFVQDAFIAFLDAVVQAFVFLVGLIPIPSWLSSGLSAPWSGMDGGVIWIATQCGVPAALAIVGAGYLFRLTRKFFTLFQW
jgi:hypothetical protein